MTEGRTGVRHRPANFVWGFVSQGASSATNLGVSVLGGRIAGASGLGGIFLGFAVYLLALGFQRALITEPLLASSTTFAADDRARTARSGLSMCLVWGALAVGAAALLSQVGPQEIGHGVALFAPWLVPALVQDYWRAVLFRDGRGRAAAVNDALWGLVMLGTAPLALHAGTDWAAVACWGTGATAGAVVGFAQAHAVPAQLGPSMKWWVRGAWPLGKWLSGSFAVYTLGSQILIFLLAGVLTVRELGGYRAGQSIFAPLTLIAPALALPGLPYLSVRASVAPARAVRAAAGLGLGGAALGIAYLAVMAATGGRVIEWVYGPSFAPFGRLLWPLGVGQLLTIASIGFALLLRVQSRGKALFVGRSVGAVASLGLGLGGAAAFGVLGAAWGATLGAALAGVIMMGLVLWRSDARITPVPAEQERALAHDEPAIAPLQ